MPCSSYLRAGRLSLLLPPSSTCGSGYPLQTRPGSPQSDPRAPDSNYQPSPHHDTRVPAEVSPHCPDSRPISTSAAFPNSLHSWQNKWSAVNECRKRDAKTCGKRSWVDLHRMPLWNYSTVLYFFLFVCFSHFLLGFSSPLALVTTSGVKRYYKKQFFDMLGSFYQQGRALKNVKSDLWLWVEKGLCLKCIWFYFLFNPNPYFKSQNNKIVDKPKPIYDYSTVSCFILFIQCTVYIPEVISKTRSPKIRYQNKITHLERQSRALFRWV